MTFRTFVGCKYEFQSFNPNALMSQHVRLCFSCLRGFLVSSTLVAPDQHCPGWELFQMHRTQWHIPRNDLALEITESQVRGKDCYQQTGSFLTVVNINSFSKKRADCRRPLAVNHKAPTLLRAYANPGFLRPALTLPHDPQEGLWPDCWHSPWTRGQKGTEMSLPEKQGLYLWGIHTSNNM